MNHAMLKPCSGAASGLLLALILGAGVGQSALAGPASEEGEGMPAVPLVVPVGDDGVQRAIVILDSYVYRPSHLIVQAGRPVELTLTSVTFLTPHNFVLQEPAAGLEMNQDVRAGKTVTVRFTPTQPGRFTFYCDKQLLFFESHREKGMEGTLEVLP